MDCSGMNVGDVALEEVLRRITSFSLPKGHLSDTLHVDTTLRIHRHDCICALSPRLPIETGSYSYVSLGVASPQALKIRRSPR